MSMKAVERAAAIVRDSGGEVVGRTRLQKIAYLLSVAGLEDCFRFTYKHYGPYSETLANAARSASLLGLLDEVEKRASWGGVYSVYHLSNFHRSSENSARGELASKVAHVDTIELELAATAVFLFLEGYSDPWVETERRKPSKAGNGRLEKAKNLYRDLLSVDTPRPLPQIL